MRFVLILAGIAIIGLAWFAWDAITGFGCAFANLRDCPANWTGAEARGIIWPFFMLGGGLIAWGLVLWAMRK